MVSGNGEEDVVEPAPAFCEALELLLGSLRISQIAECEYADRSILGIWSVLEIFNDLPNDLGGFVGVAVPIVVAASRDIARGQQNADRLRLVRLGRRLRVQSRRLESEDNDSRQNGFPDVI